MLDMQRLTTHSFLDGSFLKLAALKLLSAMLTGISIQSESPRVLPHKWMEWMEMDSSG